VDRDPGGRRGEPETMMKRWVAAVVAGDDREKNGGSINQISVSPGVWLLGNNGHGSERTTRAILSGRRKNERTFGTRRWVFTARSRPPGIFLYASVPCRRGALTRRIDAPPSADWG